MAGELLLVGSIPLDTVEQVFRTVGASLGPYLAYMPDGEVGDRRYWIDGVAYRVLNGHPEIETLRRPAPDENGVERWRPQGVHDQFQFRVKPGVREVRFGDPGWRLGYTRDAVNSYFVFRQLKKEGVIPAGVRFQVCMPLTYSAVTSFFSRPRGPPAHRAGVHRRAARRNGENGRSDPARRPRHPVGSGGRKPLSRSDTHPRRGKGGATGGGASDGARSRNIAAYTAGGSARISFLFRHLERLAVAAAERSDRLGAAAQRGSCRVRTTRRFSTYADTGLRRRCVLRAVTRPRGRRRQSLSRGDPSHARRFGLARPTEFGVEIPEGIRPRGALRFWPGAGAAGEAINGIRLGRAPRLYADHPGRPPRRREPIARGRASRWIVALRTDHSRSRLCRKTAARMPLAGAPDERPSAVGAASRRSDPRACRALLHLPARSRACRGDQGRGAGGRVGRRAGPFVAKVLL